MKILHRNILILIIAVIESALVTIGLDIGGNNIGSIAFLFYANIIGAATMLLFIYITNRNHDFIKLLKNYKQFSFIFLLGILVAGFSEWFLIIGTIQATPSISSIIYRTYPLMILVLTPFIIRQKITFKQIVALLLAFFSVYIILSRGTILLIDFSKIYTITLLTISAFLIALTTLLIKKYNIDAIIFMEVSAIGGIIFFLILAILLHVNLAVSLSQSAALSLIFIGFIEFGIGGALFYYIYKIFKPSTAGIAMLSVPFITILLSFLIIGTPIKLYYIMAALPILLSIFIQRDSMLTAPLYNIKAKKSNILSKMVIYDVTDAVANNYFLKDKLKGGRKALAIKLKDYNCNYCYDYNDYKSIEKLFEGLDCKIFTNIQNENIKDDEIEFLNKLLKLEKKDNILIAVGNENNIEEAFERLTINKNI